MTAMFENPPINEVVIGIYFSPLNDFRSEHVGLLWQEMKPEFPVVQQRFPTGPINESTFMSSDSGDEEIFPMPRYWFIAKDDVNVLQVQKDALMLNWRRREEEYTHFWEGIKPTFDKYYDVFSNFVYRELNLAELNVECFELTYVNIIPKTEGWDGPENPHQTIPSLSVPVPGLEHSGFPYFNCNFGYSIADDLQLNVGIRSGQPADEPNPPFMMLELKAVGLQDQRSKSDPDEWFQRAHDTIVSAFLNLTSQEIQEQLWKRRGTDHAH